MCIRDSYYFNLTESFLSSNHSESLIIFNKILKEGFDGHHFIIGLSAHFRDLLVCKDEATVELLEVSGGVKERYAEQAKKASLSFLLSALNISALCDQGYKTSKNQRLHVELTLMKIAHLQDAIQLADEIKKKD